MFLYSKGLIRCLIVLGKWIFDDVTITSALRSDMLIWEKMF